MTIIKKAVMNYIQILKKDMLSSTEKDKVETCKRKCQVKNTVPWKKEMERML